MFPGPADDVVCRQGAGLTRNFASLLEQHERRDAADVVALGEGGFELGVDFGQAHVWFKLNGCALELWCHYLAGATPWCPEIN